MSRGWSHRALSFLLVGEMKGWLASLRAPGPCSGAPCWRKCSQNDSVAVAGTTVEHLYGIIAICTHVLVSLFLLGRIRNKAEVDEAAVDAILSLNIISAKYLKSSHNSSRWGTLRSVTSQSCRAD